MKESIGFIGGGRIVRILLQGWKEGGKLPEDVIVSDPDQVALDRIAGEFPGVRVVRDNNALAAAQDMVFLSIPPGVEENVLSAVAADLKEKAIVISLVPGLSISRISGLLGGFDRIVRAIPNAPSIVGSGYTPVTFSPALRKWDGSSLEMLLESVSHMIDVPEEDLEAYAIITAMGPTYLWFQLYELEKIAESFGIPPERASDAVRKMAEGAVLTMRWSNLAPEQVMDLVPVRPLGKDEATIREIYRKRLSEFFQTLKR